MKYLSTATFALLLVFAGQANASLIGDSVDATLVAEFGFDIDSNFVGPQVVDGGVEFSGMATISGDQIWQIDLDVFESGFSISFLELTLNGDGGHGSNLNIVTVSLSDLDWVGSPGIITNVYLDDYSCNSPGTSCGTFGGGPFVTNIAFGDHSTAVSFNALLSGETYVFAIDAEHGVIPEPATMTLMGLGLAGLAMRRRKSNA